MFPTSTKFCYQFLPVPGQYMPPTFQILLKSAQKSSNPRWDIEGSLYAWTFTWFVSGQREGLSGEARMPLCRSLKDACTPTLKAADGMICPYSDAMDQKPHDMQWPLEKPQRPQAPYKADLGSLVTVIGQRVARQGQVPHQSLPAGRCYSEESRDGIWSWSFRWDPKTVGLKETKYQKLKISMAVMQYQIWRASARSNAMNIDEELTSSRSATGMCACDFSSRIGKNVQSPNVNCAI